MINIKLISSYPIGQKCGGFWVTVKKTKKLFELDVTCIHTVIIVDESGEMLADVNVGKRRPLTRNQRIRVVVGIIQQSEDTTKLFVDEFEPESLTEPPDVMNFFGEQKKVIRGKIKCWLVAAKIQSGAEDIEVKNFVDSPILENIVDSIMEG